MERLIELYAEGNEAERSEIIAVLTLIKRYGNDFINACKKKNKEELRRIIAEWGEKQ